MGQTPSWEEVQASQGTRLNEAAPWETYATEMDFDPEMTPELQTAVDEYSQNYHDSTSHQNEEELARWKELSAEAARDYQWLSPEEYRDSGARIGKIRHSSEIIKLLKKAGVRCWYRTHPQRGKVTLLVKRRGVEPEVGCWVQSGFAPELSIMNFDEHGVPLAEKLRGWRTVLLQLILKSILTERQANEFFGKPKVTPQFARYNGTLQSFRNAGGSLEQTR